jgi:hypothetical protein
MQATAWAGAYRSAAKRLAKGGFGVGRLLIYAACVGVPWTIIGIACLLVSGCVSGLMQSGSTPVVAPRLAFYLSAPDRFPRPAHAKDCNDYAVERAARLRAEGLEPYFAVAMVETGEGHVVTAFDRAGETLVYDNRLPDPDQPIGWRHLRYRWIARERAGHVWYPIIDDRQ